MENNTDVLDYEPYDDAAAALSFTLLVIIVCANGIVMFTLAFRHPKKSRLHYFIFHLAVAGEDLATRAPSYQTSYDNFDHFLVGLNNCLGDGIESSLHGIWHGGDVLCRVWKYLKVVFVVASNNLLVGMSIDRFLAVKSPIQFMKIGSTLDKCLVAGAWLVSVGLPVLFIPYTKGENGKACQFFFPKEWWKPYLLTVSAIIYVLPTFVITACYTGICVLVWIKWRNGLKLSEIRHTDSSLDKLRRRKSNSCGLLPRAKIRSIKMTCVICLAFFICWTPYFVFSLLDVYQTNTIDPRIYMVIGMLYPLNSACNPLIFILFNTRMFSIYKTNKRKLIPTINEGTTTTTTQLSSF